jgi:hypothetical protein
VPIDNAFHRGATITMISFLLIEAAGKASRHRAKQSL